MGTGTLGTYQLEWAAGDPECTRGASAAMRARFSCRQYVSTSWLSSAVVDAMFGRSAGLVRRRALGSEGLVESLVTWRWEDGGYPVIVCDVNESDKNSGLEPVSNKNRLQHGTLLNVYNTGYGPCIYIYPKP